MPKSSTLSSPRAGEEEVLGLDVAVDDALVVRRREHVEEPDRRAPAPRRQAGCRRGAHARSSSVSPSSSSMTRKAAPSSVDVVVEDAHRAGVARRCWRRSPRAGSAGARRCSSDSSGCSILIATRLPLRWVAGVDGGHAADAEQRVEAPLAADRGAKAALNSAHEVFPELHHKLSIYDRCGGGAGFPVVSWERKTADFVSRCWSKLLEIMTATALLRGRTLDRRKSRAQEDHPSLRAKYGHRSRTFLQPHEFGLRRRPVRRVSARPGVRAGQVARVFRQHSAQRGAGARAAPRSHVHALVDFQPGRQRSRRGSRSSHVNGNGNGNGSAALMGVSEAAVRQDRVDPLVRAYRVRGHMVANLDPLGLPRPQPAGARPGVLRLHRRRPRSHVLDRHDRRPATC